jgi:hypothetical protein
LKGVIVQYIINRTNGQVDLVGNKKDVTAAFAKLPEEVKSKVNVFVGAPGDLSAVLTMAELVMLYNAHCDEEKKVTRFNSKEVGAQQAFALLETKNDPKVAQRLAKERASAEKAAAKAAGTATNGASAPRTPRTDSKQAKLIACLQEGPKTLAQMVAASGYDENNTRTAVGNIRRKGYNVTLDKESGVYTLQAAGTGAAAAQATAQAA